MKKLLAVLFILLLTTQTAFAGVDLKISRIYKIGSEVYYDVENGGSDAIDPSVTVLTQVGIAKDTRRPGSAMYRNLTIHANDQSYKSAGGSSYDFFYTLASVFRIYIINVCVDPLNTIQETDETNNCNRIIYT